MQVNCKKISGLRFAALLLALAISSGCVSLAARALKSFVSDPRSKNHEFYTRVEISFNINGMNVRAVRYADVYSLAGSGNSYFPPCDRTKPTCWKQTDHYFIGLPNGDIVDVFVSGQDITLPEMAEGVSVNAKAMLTQIYRDQPQSPYVKEHGSCLSLSPEDLSSFYNIPIKTSKMAMNPYPDFDRVKILVNITKLDKIPYGSRIIDVDRFLENKIFDRESCKYLLNKFSLSTDVNIQ